MKYFFLVWALVLAGCASTPPVVNKVHHVPFPDPITGFNKQWEVKVINDVPYVALKYEDFLDFETWLIDVKRYNKDLKSMVCYYRTDLDEETCKE